MGLFNSPDIFQEKMNEIFVVFDYVRAYIDDLLIITKGSFEEHLKQLDTVLEKLETAGLKINASKSCLIAHELEYLGFWISQDGTQPLAAKVEALKKMAKPEYRRALCSFIGMINYYRDMWKRQSALLALLIVLTSDNVPWTWDGKHQKAFDAVKKNHGKRFCPIQISTSRLTYIRTPATYNSALS